MEFTFYNVIYSLQSNFLDVLRKPVEKKNFSKPRPARGGVHAGKNREMKTFLRIFKKHRVITYSYIPDYHT